MKTLRKSLGETIRRERVSRNIGFLDFAVKSGVGKGLLSKLESGQSNACLSTLGNVCYALKMTPSQIFKKAGF